MFKYVIVFIQLKNEKNKIINSRLPGENGQQLIKSSKNEKNFKLISVTENRIVNKKVSGLRPQLNSELHLKIQI